MIQETGGNSRLLFINPVIYLSNMKPVLIIIVLLFSSFIPNEKTAPGNTWVVERSSSLAIDGSSNINKFTCDVHEYIKPDTLRWVPEESSGKLIFLNSILRLDLKRFDCHHKYITSDFRKMLKVDAHPNLIIKMVSVEGFSRDKDVKGVVDIELSGTKKRMEVVFHGTSYGHNLVKLEGKKAMKFSDFGLVPPRKIGGLIRINEEILVHFNLHFRKLI
jgi:hypothetical protein